MTVLIPPNIGPASTGTVAGLAPECWTGITGIRIPTRGRRRIDVVAYDNGRLVALIETESDLNDLRLDGVTKRNGHYDVYSIARAADGNYFHSYNSLERMASAAYCVYVRLQLGRSPTHEQLVQHLDSLQSDDAALHNPHRIPLFLVSGSCRPIDRRILAPRMSAVGATLICRRVI